MQSFSKSSISSRIGALASCALAVGDSFESFANESELEQVVVTAAGFQQKIIDAPASISVMTAEQLRKQALPL